MIDTGLFDTGPQCLAPLASGIRSQLVQLDFEPAQAVGSGHCSALQGLLMACSRRCRSRHGQSGEIECAVFRYRLGFLQGGVTGFACPGPVPWW